MPRQVVRAVPPAHGLAVVGVLRKLFEAAVEVADVRLAVDDDLAVDGEHHTEDAVRGGVLGADVDRHVDGVEFGFLDQRFRRDSGQTRH